MQLKMVELQDMKQIDSKWEKKDIILIKMIKLLLNHQQPRFLFKIQYLI